METRRSENVEDKKKKRKGEGSIKGGIKQGKGLLERVQSQHKNLKEKHDRK